MSKKNGNKSQLIKANKPKGFEDHLGQYNKQVSNLVSIIDNIVDNYGYDILVTPTFEWSRTIGKFLPDTDRPGNGVFSIEDEKNWLSMRYDLTAPLARFVAENFDKVPRPFKRRQNGLVYRNEKPGPGRFREFLQYDIDIVGAPFGIADVEILQILSSLFSDKLFSDYDFKTHYSDRNIASTVINNLSDVNDENVLTIFRAIDKLDRLGIEGVISLLGEGRKDGSGDFTKGANLQSNDIDKIVNLLSLKFENKDDISKLAAIIGDSEEGKKAISNIEFLQNMTSKLGIEQYCKFDVSIIRGLDYYTGTVFETILSDKNTGKELSGAVAGGGRYDNLIRRFINQDIPAIGASFGVSRIISLLENEISNDDNLVMIANMDNDQASRYLQMASKLRDENINVFVYPGSAGMKAQMKYADKRNVKLVLIEGEEERSKSIIEVKDMDLGRKLAENIDEHSVWKEERPAQFSIAFDEAVKKIKEYLST